MNNKVNYHALKTVIEAYENKGKFIQYDQLSMDRIAGISARRIGMDPPEAANSNHYIFLDCSSFCWACFYEAFSYKLESDLTWHMIDLIKPRVYYYELTHNESERDIAVECETLKPLLEPGDLIVYENEDKFGHAMIYLNDKEYINCSQKGKFNGYSYNDCKEYLGSGSIIREPIESLFYPNIAYPSSRNYLFGQDKKRFAVLRPLDRVKGPTANTIARMDGAANLNINIETSYPPGCTADINKPIRYYININNHSSSKRKINLLFRAPEHTEAIGDTCIEAYLEAQEQRSFSFDIKVIDQIDEVKQGFVIINGLEVATPHVCVGRVLNKHEWDEITNYLHDNNIQPQEVVDSALEWYRLQGSYANLNKNEIFYNLFSLKDGVSGDILFRFPQKPKSDAGALKLYGGRGVVCPDISTGYKYKENQIKLESLMPGDIILISEEATCVNHYSCFYTGEAMFFDKAINKKMDIPIVTSNKDINKDTYVLDSRNMMETFVEKLFGEFAFVVLRPSLSLEE